jgi:hypothetical protein
MEVVDATCGTECRGGEEEEGYQAIEKYQREDL